jgi:hypothetical protein
MASFRCLAPASTWPPSARPRGMPTSVVIAAAIAGMRRLYASRSRVRYSMRSSRDVCE